MTFQIFSIPLTIVPLMVLSMASNAVSDSPPEDSRNAQFDRRYIQYADYQNPRSQTPPQAPPQAQYQPRGSYGPPPAYYPSYPAYPVYPGGYLPPGPVDPGQDEADWIYQQNQHPPQV